MAVSFVDCREAHLAPLLEFFGRVYRPDYKLRVPELFRWQFGSRAAGREKSYHLKLALVDGEISGCLGYIPVEAALCGRVVRGGWVINWMVDPNQRRLGLGPFLMREVMRLFEVGLDLGPNRDARDLLARMGWKDFGDLPRYVHVLDRETAGTLTESGQLDWPVRAMRPGPAARADATVQPVDRFGADATCLWDRVWGTPEATGGGTRRSCEFLNWRYADHPLFQYRLFQARQNGRLAGLGVYRVEPVKGKAVRVGRLVELVAEEGREAALLHAILGDARSQGVSVVDFFCSSRRLAGVLTGHGFVSDKDPATAQIPILFQPIDRRRAGVGFMAHFGSVPEAARVQDWYVTKSDGDQDRPN